MAIASTTASEVRHRSRDPRAGNTTPQPNQPGRAASWMATGDKAVDAAASAVEETTARMSAQNSSRNQPLRMRLSKSEKADIVILDEDLGPGFWEYDLTWDPDFRRNRPGTNRPFDQYIISCKEFENDPLMDMGRNPGFVVYVSVIDMRQGTSAKGKAFGNTKKLLPLKGDALNMLTEIRNQRMKAGENLRGVQLVMARGTDDKSLRTGLPMFVARHSEQDIIETFAHPERKTEKGEVYAEANSDCFPYDYSAMWEQPTAAAIRERLGLGGSTQAGSNDAFNQEFAGQAAPQSGGGTARGQGIQSSTGSTPSGPANTDFRSADLDDEIPF